MAPLVHMVFRQSRTLRDVIVMSCMLDLARDDVSTALDLAAARIEGLLRGALTRLKAGRFGLIGPRFRLLLPAVALIAWFALPMTVVAGVCAALVGFELASAGP